MHNVRYSIALLLVVSLPPGLLFWRLIHPLVGFWRRLGPGWTYSVVGTRVVAGMVGLWCLRHALLAREFGTSYPLMALGIVCLAVSAWLRLLLHRRISTWTLLGWPELASERSPAPLITSGLYACLRHPRYAQLALAFLGYALVANYLALDVVWLLCVPIFFLIVVLEERELRDRFGDAYVEYCRRVPRFVPRNAP